VPSESGQTGMVNHNEAPDQSRDQRILIMKRNRQGDTLEFALKDLDQILITGIGKVSTRMAAYFESALLGADDVKGEIAERVSGLVVTKHGHYYQGPDTPVDLDNSPASQPEEKSALASGQETSAIEQDQPQANGPQLLILGQSRLQRVHVREAGHPIPTRESVKSAAEFARLLITAALGRTEDPHMSREMKQRDILILNVISGGGSALMTAVSDPEITIDDIRTFNEVVLASGMPIHEINTLRKRVDLFKGGGLLRFCQGLSQLMQRRIHVVSFIVSDVIGDNVSVIASGPTWFPQTAAIDEQSPGPQPTPVELVERYSLREKLPASILKAFTADAESKAGEVTQSQILSLLSGCRGQRTEEDECNCMFNLVKQIQQLAPSNQSLCTGNIADNFVIQSIGDAFESTAGITPILEYSRILGTTLAGEVRDVVDRLRDEAEELIVSYLMKSGYSEQSGSVHTHQDMSIQAGGEITVNLDLVDRDEEEFTRKVTKLGVTWNMPKRGGRCQELAARCLLWLDEWTEPFRPRKLQEGQFENLAVRITDAAVLCCGTDGTDGPTPAAGAVVSLADLTHLTQSLGKSRDYIRTELECAIRQHSTFTWLDQRIGRTIPASTTTGLVFTGPTGTNVMDFYYISFRVELISNH